jgi:hypothetical protein
MNLDLLVDPLFRVPFLTGLLLAGLLPLIGMYLRLRGEWLAALAFAQMASAGALLAMVLGWPMLAGGAMAALLASLAKGLAAAAGANAYALMMLLAWGAGCSWWPIIPSPSRRGMPCSTASSISPARDTCWPLPSSVPGCFRCCCASTAPCCSRVSFPSFTRPGGWMRGPGLMLFDLLAGW